MTWEEFGQRMDLLFQTEEEAYRQFRPRPSDVIISPHSKCGTTWLQQITHSLRTGGDMNFDDIYEVVPFIDVALDMGIDLGADQRGEPRLFKSHCSWHDVPKGCRYIVSFRDPQDAAVSFFHFVTGWIIEPGAIPLNEFVARRALNRGSGLDYWAHMTSWLEQRDNPDVLLLTFEHMKDDLPAVVARIADFMGTGDDVIDVAVQNSSFDFMASHRERFSEPWMRSQAERVAGIPVDGDASKVRQGAVGTNRQELSQDMRDLLDDIWKQTIAADFGWATYTELDAAVRESSSR